MTRRTRNKICIWIILLGLANFLGYTIAYGYIGGDARNGGIEEDGRCYVRGHFIKHAAGRPTDVTRGVWIYSYLHSISIWPTIAAVLTAMLILARPHIIATMKGDMISGQTLIVGMITATILISGTMTIWFIADFIGEIGEAL